MRSDFAKVVTERPRSGSRSAPSPKTRFRVRVYDPEYEHKELDKLPPISPMSPEKYENNGQRYNTKEFTDRLGPLWRYLKSQVGRPWNKVKSEAFKQLHRTFPARHVLFTHLLTSVEENVELIQRGKMKVVVRVKDGKEIFEDYYVHPVTGILTETKKGYYNKSTPYVNSHGHKWVKDHPLRDYHRGDLYLDKSKRKFNHNHWFLIVADPLVIIEWIGNCWIKRTFKEIVEYEYVRPHSWMKTTNLRKDKIVRYELIKAKVLNQKEIDYFEMSTEPRS